MAPVRLSLGRIDFTGFEFRCLVTVEDGEFFELRTAETDLPLRGLQDAGTVPISIHLAQMVEDIPSLEIAGVSPQRIHQGAIRVEVVVENSHAGFLAISAQNPGAI